MHPQMGVYPNSQNSRIHHINSLRYLVPGAIPLDAYQTTWKISFVAPDFTPINELEIILPINFPSERPIVRLCKPTLKHPWIDGHNYLTLCPGIQHWNPVTSDLGAVVISLVRELQAAALRSGPERPVTEMRVQPHSESLRPHSGNLVNEPKLQDLKYSGGVFNVHIPNISRGSLPKTGSDESKFIMENSGAVVPWIKAQPEVKTYIDLRGDMINANEKLLNKLTNTKEEVDKLKLIHDAEWEDLQKKNTEFRKLMGTQHQLAMRGDPSELINILTDQIDEEETKCLDIVEELKQKQLTSVEFRQKLYEKRLEINKMCCKVEKLKNELGPEVAQNEEVLA